MKIRASSMSKIMGYLPDYKDLQEKTNSSRKIFQEKVIKKYPVAKSIEKLSDDDLILDLKVRYSEGYPKGCKKEYDDFIKYYTKLNTPDELPQGAKNYAHTLFIEEQGLDLTLEGFMAQTQKGHLVEDDGIELINELKGKFYQKNTLRAEYNLETGNIIKYDPFLTESPSFNFCISGECDIYSKSENLVRDIKCPQNFKTYTNHKGISSNYYWQLITYSLLWSVDNLSLDFCLMPTPYEVYKNFKEENQQQVRDFNQKVLELPLNQRLKSFNIPTEEIIYAQEAILKRSRMLMEYYKTLTLEKLIYEEDTCD